MSNTTVHVGHLLRLVAISLLAAMVSSGVLLAQESRATLTGTVVDAQGAFVPRASLVAKNLATNAETKTNTDEAGLYVLPFLTPGTYSVTVSAPGFKTELNAHLLLTIGERRQLDFTLAVGGVNEQVTVTSTTELLDTANASRETLMDADKINDLPLLGKNTYTLAYQADGALHINPQPSVTDRPYDNGGMDYIRINGAPQYTNEYLLDGAPNTNIENGNVDSLSFVPPPDAVTEMAVVSNNYDAQFGRVGGGTISATLKSGGNKLHGAMYEYYREKILMANTWQSNFAGTPRGPFLWNQPGVTANGPVYVPKLYDGRNKTFFLFSWEAIYNNIPNPGLETVPTAANRAGDFTSAHTTSGAPITIYDPLTTPLTGSPIRQPFPGNIIPASRMDPVALKMLSYVPLPNFTPNSAGFQNFNPTGASTVTDLRYNAYTMKLDQTITQNERFSAHYVTNKRFESDPYYDFTIPARGPQNFERYNQGANAQLTSTVSPTFVVTTRFGFTEHIFQTLMPVGPNGQRDFDPSQLGFPANYVNQAQGLFFPTISFTNYQGFGQPGNSGDFSTNWYFTVSANKVYGKHSLKFGFEFRDLFNNLPAYSFGTFAFSTQWTQQNATTAAAQAGNDFASYLLGLPATGSSTINAAPAYGNHYWGTYVQDDYRLAPNLTLNIGIRWDYESPLTERFNREDAGWAFSAANPLSQQAGIPLQGGLLFTSGSDRLPWKRDINPPQPRVGVAYHLAKNTVLRAGYGLSYLPTYITGQSQGYTVASPMVVSYNNNLTPVGNLFNPFPTGLIQPTGSSLGLATALGQSVTFTDPDRTIPFIHQFSAGFQHELPSHVLVDMSFVGSRTRRLTVSQNIDALTTAQLGLGTPYLNTVVTNPFYNLVPGTSINGATVSERQLLLPYPEFSGVTEAGVPIGRSWYNSFQIQVQKRLASGFHILANFAYSELMQATSFLNPQFNADQLEKVRAPEDLPLRMSIAGGYQFPFFQHSNRLAKAALAGWQVQAIGLFQSGRMLTGVAGAYPTGANQSISGVPYEPNNYAFNACSLTTTGVRQNCTSTTQAVAWIQLPTDTLAVDSTEWQQMRERRPPLMDSSLFKTFYPKEGLRLQFRLEAFNTFNTPWFGQSNTTFTGARFGLINNTQANDVRSLQLALKLTF
jgi:hypothetical protein